MNTLKNYDAEFCGSLPLHLINLIQPHGILMILGFDDLRIIQISENVKEFLDIDPHEILNKSLHDFIHEDDFQNVKEKLEKWSTKDRIPVNLRFNFGKKYKEFSANFNPGEKYVMVELESVQSQEENSFLEIYQEIKYIIASLKEAIDVNEIADISSIEIKKLSGFDRVMIYKFDDEWNGSVIAEAKEPHMDTYLHLHFPASDVPKQARELYHKNPYRLIPTVDYTPVKLIPVINPIQRSFIDLSESTLRSVPAVHLEYLRNMDVKASMSTPLIINNNLWGLISCHHETPKFLSYPYRAAFELLASMISLQIAAKENERKLSIKTRLNDINFQLLERVISGSDIIDSLFTRSPNFLDLLNISGAAVKFDSRYKLFGETPNEEQLEDMIRWVNISDRYQIYFTHNLPYIYSESYEFKDIASGLIIIPISPRDKEYIFGFRKEVVQNIDWGGNPNDAINFEENGKTYHPRNSFSKWKEKVEGTSDRWLPQEIEAAEALRTTILEKLLNDKS